MAFKIAAVACLGFTVLSMTGPDLRQLLQETFLVALDAVRPEVLLAPHLVGPRPDLILAFGKASLPMTRAALQVFPGVPALVVPPLGTGNLTAPPGATVLPARHPVPDETSVAAAREALKRIGVLQAGQRALVLVSGGGSALLCLPQGVNLPQKQALTQQLLRAGASIGEINTVRRHLSGIKGGQLAQATRARVDAFLLSDVVGDDPAVIASGPTVPDPTTFADALRVLDSYDLSAPEARAYFQERLSETPKTLPHVSNTVIGSNRLLLQAAARHLETQGVRAVILGDTFTGEARELAGFHASLVHSIRQQGSPVSSPVMLLSGGEATVTLRGNGVGGRNQEFALALALALGEAGVFALSAGSDGIDGSSQAAGAFLTPDTLTRARSLGLQAQAALQNNDSGSFFATLGDALTTGPTGHNLNDLRAIYVGPSS